MCDAPLSNDNVMPTIGNKKRVPFLHSVNKLRSSKFWVFFRRGKSSVAY